MALLFFLLDEVIIEFMSKEDTINIMKNPNLHKKVDCYQFFIIYKNSDKTTYYKKNRDIILNRAKKIL